MRRRAALIGYCGLLWLATSAHAADIILVSRLNQSFTIDSNYQLQAHPPGETYLPVSTLAFDALVRTPTLKWFTTVDFNYRSYFGPGAENLLPGLDRGLLSSIEKRDYATTYKLTASRRTSQSATLQLAETGVNTIGGETTTTFVDGMITHQLSTWDTLSLNARASTTQFNNTTTPTTSSLDIATTGTWRHRLTPLFEISPIIQYETINYDNAAKTQSQFWRGWTSFDSRLTKRLRAHGSIGVTRLEITQNGVANAPNPAQQASGIGTTWVGDILLTYQLTALDSLTFAAARSITPDSFGQIRGIDIVGTTFTHRINSYSSLGFSAQASHQVSLNNTTDLYSSSITYSYQLARNWYTDLSYRFRQRVLSQNTPGTQGPATSNAMFFSIRRDFTILATGTDHAPAPVALDPTALMAAPAEWAITRRFDAGISY